MATLEPEGVTWEESVDVALRFGWIDGIRKAVDDEAYTVRFTLRRAGSIWSRRNIERYRVLLEDGRVAPSGQEAFERRPQGRAGIYSFEQETAPELSDAFETRLREDAAAWADWEARSAGYRRQAAHWIMSAKREATRERRFAALLEDCAAGRKVKPLR